MTLATVDDRSRPSARIVLIKDLSRTAGFLTFYTHYVSRKATELESIPYAAGVLHWDKLGRQIRLEGRVVRSPADESDAYFATRPVGSQLNAWVSEQSHSLESMEELTRKARDKAKDFGLDAAPTDDRRLPRPAFWGGYRLWFSAVEFWQEGENRFHQRLRYERTLTSRDAHHFAAGPWSCQLLQP